jgi:hypothetical protein
LVPTEDVGRNLQLKDFFDQPWEQRTPGFYPPYTQEGWYSLEDKSSFLGLAAELIACVKSDA